MKNFIPKFFCNKDNRKHVSRPLESQEWSQLYNTSLLTSLVSDIKKENFTWQTREMLKLSSPGDSVLEIGSGTGETTLCLALQRRICTALDFAKPCLELARQAAQELNCPIETIFADASQELPFADDSFDIVFQAGVLEHFDKEERIRLLRLWGRVCNTMISIIPNAASLAYRVGKALQEKEGRWPYGMELPQYSLYEEFLEAGFNVTHEYTIGEEHSLNFLPPSHYLRRALARWMAENECGDNCGQGYLLITVGSKIRRLKGKMKDTLILK